MWEDHINIFKVDRSIDFLEKEIEPIRRAKCASFKDIDKRISKNG
jgi:hypothetical protein